MYFKKTVFVSICVGFIIISCTKLEEGSKTSTKIDNTPKGQASVVDEESDRNILQIAISSDAHTTLVKAVEAANIEHVLVNAGPLTVFAPTNDAFNDLPKQLVDKLLKPENRAELSQVLTLHAAPGTFDIAALTKAAVKERDLYMATGHYLSISNSNGVITVNDAKILSTIEASNGIIHVVDKVFLPNPKNQ
jgi:uncharacterized surface protein with fasciclin (FAS1) repeats